MKTAISLPDALFFSAEQVAERLGIARSQLFALALEEFIHNHSYQGIKESLDSVYSSEDSSIDPFFMSAELHSLQFGSNNEAW